MKYLLLCLISFSAFALVLKPDMNKTPGYFCDKNNPDFKELRYKEQIPVCKRNVSVSLKNKIYADYGVAVEERKDYTIDHKIPLSLGGSNDQMNLWPQHKLIYTGVLELLVFNLINEQRINHKEALDLVLSVKK